VQVPVGDHDLLDHLLDRGLAPRRLVPPDLHARGPVSGIRHHDGELLGRGVLVDGDRRVVEVRRPELAPDVGRFLHGDVALVDALAVVADLRGVPVAGLVRDPFHAVVATVLDHVVVATDVARVAQDAPQAVHADPTQLPAVLGLGPQELPVLDTGLVEVVAPAALIAEATEPGVAVVGTVHGRPGRESRLLAAAGRQQEEEGERPDPPHGAWNRNASAAYALQ
jgi:hypothetical protein